MNKYELALVLNPTLDETTMKNELERAKNIITKNGGNITNVDEWGRKKLAYEIAGHREGIYFFIAFDAEASVPKSVEAEMRIVESVLRYLVVREEA